MQWDPNCLSKCLKSIMPIPVSTAVVINKTSSAPHIPSEYGDLLKAFSKTKASKLLQQGPSDCVIELLPGTMQHRSEPEAEALKTHIEEELAKGFIHPSTSPGAAGFFFMGEKDGGLHPCIDYRVLNEITVNFRCPLPLVPAALEQLKTAKVFTKLDLHSVYNLLRI